MRRREKLAVNHATYYIASTVCRTKASDRTSGRYDPSLPSFTHMRNMTMKAKGGDAYKKPQATGVETDRIGSPEFAAVSDGLLHLPTTLHAAHCSTYAPWHVAQNNGDFGRCDQHPAWTGTTGL